MSDDGKGVLANLEDKKGKVNHNQMFEVEIREVSIMKVMVEAENACEAEQIVNDAWCNEEYVLDSEHFECVDFSASPVKPERVARMEI